MFIRLETVHNLSLIHISHKQILSAQGYEPMNVDYLTFDAEELELIDNMFGD